MTWSTNLGDRTLVGAEAELFRYAVSEMVEIVEDELGGCIGIGHWGVNLFEELEPEARLAMLAEVTEALLRKTPACPRLTSLNEATVAAVFAHIGRMVQLEIESADDMEDPYIYRARILAAEREFDDAEDIDDERPDMRCTDWDRWEQLVENAADRILWDRDYECVGLMDLSPDVAATVHDTLSISNDYYRAVPPNPDEDDLEAIRATLAELCAPPGGDGSIHA